MKRSDSPITMQDVADLAGVSKTTVSFVINNKPNTNIPSETRDRVWAAVAALRYRPNRLAQSLRGKRSGIIGFVTDQIAITPHAGKIFEGAQDLAWEHNRILLLVNTKGVPDVEETAVEMLLERQVEGIILATMYHRAIQPPEAVREVPTVLLDCYVEDRSLPSVVPDEMDGGRRATEVLLQKGHRRIAYINNAGPVPASIGRLAGYRAALEAAGVPFDEQLVCVGNSDPAGGYRCTLELMALPDPPSAIFCFNDRMAMGAYDALRKLNLEVPDDVAVIGFDNQELIAANLYPPLSTMELPHYEMGRWAFQHLIQLQEGMAPPEPVQQKLACPYIERASV